MVDRAWRIWQYRHPGALMQRWTSEPLLIPPGNPPFAAADLEFEDVRHDAERDDGLLRFGRLCPIGYA